MSQTSAVIASYRALICDLDGVVYRGPVAVPGAADTINKLVADGVGVVFATNNASRPPAEVGAHLTELGIQEGDWSVAGSSQAAAAYLAERLSPNAPVFAVGGPGVFQALEEVGLVPVRSDELEGIHVEAMVQGLGVDVTWRDLSELGYLAQRGVQWVATNLDITLPTAHGHAPGNGAMVGAVQTTTSAKPHVVGKPGAALYDLARTRLGAEHAETLAVGDRLDTDIVGANAAGVDSLFVLSGASRLQELVFAERNSRATYIAPDMAGLLKPLRRLDSPSDDLVEITATGEVHILDESADTDDLLHAVVAAAWVALDAGQPVSYEADLWRGLESKLAKFTS